ncbi:MAG: hypothetical protein QGH19_01575, partial [Candidatus Woesearchaeota archaeon]|nr:hypothetical protein [Candidatus Woesearchaeota archaeon]
NETDTDCGGSCPPCGEGDVCKSDSDCISDECLATKCTQPETCENSKLDEDETDFDCGGPCKKCESGKQCKDDSDCIGHFCKGSVCLEASCEDKELNQGEADIDCGGPCPGCEIGSSCDLNSDCSSGTCEANICVQPLDSDSDGLPNDWEILYDLDPNNKDSNGNGILDPDEDLDDDGLTNLEEWESKYAIDPRNSDTDGDSYSDKEELDAGTDPTDSESFPRPNYFLIILVITVIIGVFGGGGYYGYKYIKENKEMIKSWLKTKLKKSIPAKQPTQSPKAQPASPLQRPIIPSQRAAPRVPVKTALHKKRIIKQKAEKGKKREKLFESFSGEGLGEAKPPKKAKKPSADDFDIKPIKLKPLKKKKRTYPLHRHIAGKSTAATRKPITSIGRTPPTTTKAMPTTSLSPSQTAQKPAIPPKAHPSGIMDQLKSLISKPEEKAGPLGKIRNPLKTTKLTLAKPPSSKPAPIGKINVFDKLMGFSKHDLTKLEVKQHLSKHMSNTFGKEIKEDTFNKLTNLVKSDKVERKDIFNTIKHLSKRGHKEFTKTASKHMLSHLINTNKSNKAHVTDVLHSLKDKKIFSDDDVFDILGHIEEHEQKK